MKLDQYVAERGAQARLARALRCQSQLVWQWAKEVRQVPIDRCPDVEAATEGAVTCEELRPDATWVRVPSDWKWHASGRPLLDVIAKREPVLAS